MDEATRTRPPLPTSLKIVAAIFILEGVSAVIGMVIALANDRLNLDFGVLNLGVGFGLLRLSSGWRTCGLVFLWITLLVCPLGVLLLLASRAQVTFNMYGMPFGSVPDEVAVTGIAAVFLLALWQYRILTRPEVRALFE